MDAIEAVSRTVKTMSDGTLRLTVDISPINAQDAFKLFGSPDVPLALARLTVESSKQRAQAEIVNDKPKGGFLSQWLYMRCNEPEFWKFVQEKSHSPVKVDSFEKCDYEIKLFLQIDSKSELDNDKEAEARFHEMVRLPYAKWLAGARMAA